MLDLTDWQNKKFQTRSGDPVRILCIDAGGTYPIVGISEGDVYRWCDSGTYDIDDQSTKDIDLINAKTKREGWLNICQGNSVSCFIRDSREEADKVAGSDRVACIHIEWDE